VRKPFRVGNLIYLPTQPLSRHDISASSIDTDESIIHTHDGTVITTMTNHLGVIGINVCVIDFDPDTGVPFPNFVA
jgi:hypothetical protein